VVQEEEGGGEECACCSDGEIERAERKELGEGTKMRLPKMPARERPAPPTTLTMRAEAWKSLPKLPRRLVRAKEAQGEAKRARAMRTSRRRTTARTSAKNLPKLSRARRRSGPGEGMRRKMVVGRKTMMPSRGAARGRGRARTSSPARMAMRPLPAKVAAQVQELSLLSSL
jgi:hypothetical protein